MPHVRENSAASGELRATAVFDPDLRELPATATRDWNDDLAERILRARTADPALARTDPHAAAERLTALVEGLSEHRLGGTTSLGRAHELIRGAVEAELRPGQAEPGRADYGRPGGSVRPARPRGPYGRRCWLIRGWPTSPRRSFGRRGEVLRSGWCGCV
ncbi:TetR family transcriptional regulator C-terminal domain-containing protein, partial [Streptomyces lydicus]|uniref:TetR family transcriptional regulator C-terminal domain-containing protein n=1 Tax=Streptomyces lydicus TaxID=47763 RepID=UPI0036C914B6